MADCKIYKDYGIPLLNQGGWEVVDDYVRYTGYYRYQERICTINYVPNFHPNTITITGIANKELEVAVLTLKNNNYVIAEMGWYENGHTFDIGNDYDKLGVAFRYADGSNIALNDVTIEEVGEWQHSLRKLTTATDTFTTLPADIYAAANTATVGISGSTVQNGTPTPDNPIMPEGTGERTGNLWNYVIEQGGWMATPGSIPTQYVPGQDHYYDRCRVPHMIPIPSNTMSFTCPSDIEIEFVWVNANGVTLSDTGWQQSGITVTAPESAVAMTFILRNVDGSACSPNDFQNIMLNTGSTPLPYEPYGVKIPISSASTTTPVYLGEVESTRRIKKLVLTGEEDWLISTAWKRASTSVFYFTSWDIFNKGYSEIFILSNKFEAASRDELYNEDSDMIARTGTNSITIRVSDSIATTAADFKAYLASQYAAGTPVTVWYVLAEPETGIVNEPLMKIGDYADTVSGITIPTITGKDTVDVETTLKPSEVELTYTGWHDATVKEWDGSDWQ